jgi:hypothetical protein
VLLPARLAHADQPRLIRSRHSVTSVIRSRRSVRPVIR